MPAVTTASRWMTAMAIGTLWLVGCAQWKEVSKKPGTDGPLENLFPKSSASPDTPVSPNRAVLEVNFVHAALDQLDADQAAGLWQWVDETSIDARTRQRLRENGIRVGMVTNLSRFQHRLESCSVKPDVVDQFFDQASIASEVVRGQQRLPMRMGRRYELPLRQPFEGSHVTLVRNEGETIGRTLENAQYVLAMTATPAEIAQKLRLEIRPEVQYGAAKQKWVSSDTAIRIDTKRETWALSMLNLPVTAAAGDTIVIAPDLPARGLAERMLTSTGTDHQHQHLIVLVHIAQVPLATEQAVARVP